MPYARIFLTFGLLLLLTQARAQIKQYPGFPESAAKIEDRYQVHGKSPQGTGWLFLAALKVYRNKPQEGMRALVQLCDSSLTASAKPGQAAYQGRSLRPALQDSLDQALGQMPYLPRAYFVSAMPFNNYRLKNQYRLMWVSQERYDPQQKRRKLLLQSNGTEELRAIKFRKGQEGYWRITDFRALLGKLLAPTNPNSN